MGSWLRKVLGKGAERLPVADAIEAAGFTWHDAAFRFLSEHAGRRIDVPIDGAPGCSGFVDFTPENVLRFADADTARRLHRLVGAPVCPIGTTGGHTIFLFLDARERSVALDLEGRLVANLAQGFEPLLALLCGGANGRVESEILDDEGRRGGGITGSNERDQWSLGSFPHLAPYLPPRALSPLRRPPTWRPLAQNLEKHLASGGDPKDLLVTGGGFAQGVDGQVYFVAHDEDSRYLRDAVGCQVAKPPPGIPADLRPGEIVPFTPPAQW